MRYKRKQLFILLVLVLLSILLLTSMALAKNLNYTIEELAKLFLSMMVLTNNNL